MKDVANCAFKAYEFSKFMSYSDLVQSQLPFEREGKFILPKPFAYDNVLLMFHIHNLKKRTKLNKFLELKMKFIQV